MMSKEKNTQLLDIINTREKLSLKYLSGFATHVHKHNSNFCLFIYLFIFNLNRVLALELH